MVTDPRTFLFHGTTHTSRGTLVLLSTLLVSRGTPSDFLFLPQLPAVWQLHPTKKISQIFSLTPPEEKGSGYRPYPDTRGLVPHSNSFPHSSLHSNSLLQSPDHFRKLACTSIQPSATFRTLCASSAPSGTLRTPVLHCVPVPHRIVPHTQSDLAADKPRTRIA